MIFVCPYCGNKLKTCLSDGITACLNCSRLFDSSSYNKLLSASWYLRKFHVDLDTLKSNCNLSDEEIEIIEKYGDSHEEFVKALDKLEISKVYYYAS